MNSEIQEGWGDFRQGVNDNLRASFKGCKSLQRLRAKIWKR